MTTDWWLALGLFALGMAAVIWGEYRDRKEWDRRVYMRRTARLIRRYDKEW